MDNNANWFIETVAWGTVLISFGTLAGSWVDRRIRKRRLMKLGFSADDVRSQESIVAKWSQLAVASTPEKITLTEAQSHAWSDPSKYQGAKTAFEGLRFRQSKTFVAVPQTWVAEFWLSDEPGLFGKIIDCPDRGVYSEVSITKIGGSLCSFENTEPCGLRHREPDAYIHCGLVSPADLVQKAMQQQQSVQKIISASEAVSAYENSVNEFLAWRRSVGYNADDMKVFAARARKRRKSG